MSEFLKQNAIQVIEGHTVTTSRIVSEYFGKKHSDVVRAITSIVANFPAGQASRNFAQWSEEVDIGGGAKRRVNGYLMDRKGFCLLAMGFTGKEALKFKIAFYDEFERMENALRNQNSVANTDRKLNTKEQYELRKAVKSRALTNSIHYQTIYNALYDYFKIASYKDLRSDQLQSAITFINACELRPQLPPPPPHPNGALVLTKDEAMRIVNFVYYWRYLFRPELEMILRLLRVVDSPKASKFCDVVVSLQLPLLEKMLKQHGFEIPALN